MARLQPYLIFKCEVSRVNELYWSSNYAYNRVCSFLGFLKDTGDHSSDPEVNSVWGVRDYAFGRASMVPFSEFSDILKNRNSEALRITSILHLCSAFENALTGYFVLCCLYDGKKFDSSYIGDNVPNLLKNSSSFEGRRNSILSLVNSSSSPLSGKYTSRLKVFSDRWGFASISNASVTRLNGYYKVRHKIAHDQGLGAPDQPEFSAAEILRDRVSLGEVEWKRMIHDFQVVLELLDDQLTRFVVKDRGLSLAVYRTLRRDGPMQTSELMDKLVREWRLGNNKKIRIHKVVHDVGGVVKQLYANTYQVSV